MLNLVYVGLVCMLLFVYAWSLHNLPIIVAGVRNLRRSRQRPERRSFEGDAPVFSIVVPVRNEEMVIGRLLEALESLGILLARRR